jgi:hypothetical protein
MQFDFHTTDFSEPTQSHVQHKQTMSAAQGREDFNETHRPPLGADKCSVSFGRRQWR